MYNVRQFISVLIALSLIAVGTLFLLSNFGVIDFDPIWLVQIFWPLVLIILGLYFIWGRNRFRMQGAVQPVVLAEELGNAVEASVRVDFGAGELQIGPSSAGDKLLAGSFLYRPGLTVRHAADTAYAELKQVEWPWNSAFSNMPGDKWRFDLPDTVPISLRINTGASRVNADLSAYRVKAIEVNTGASDITIKMPREAGLTDAKIEGGAASIRIEIPEGTAAHITSSSALANISINQTRFPKVQNAYISPDYEQAANKINIDIQTGLASVTVT